MKYIRLILFLLLFGSIVFVLQQITLFSLIVFILFLIPAGGLFSLKPWVFYYLYVVMSIFLLFTLFAIGVGSVFGMAFSPMITPLTIVVEMLLPIVYFGSILGLTIALHKNSKKLVA